MTTDVLYKKAFYDNSRTTLLERRHPKIPNDALRRRVAQLRVLQARAHAQLGDCARAEQILNEDVPVLLNGVPSMTEWAAMSMELAQCAIQGQRWSDAELYAREALQKLRVGRRVPGSHRLWAQALRELGRVEEAAEVVKRGIVYEAPWDTRNKQENWAAYEELAKEVEARAEARRKREAFMEVWGQVLGTVQEKHEEKDSPISWQTIKEKDWDMFGDDENDKEDLDESLPDYGEEETSLKVQAATRAALAAGAAEESEHSEVAWTQTAAERELASVESGPEEKCIKEYIDIKLTKGALKDIEKLDTVTRENAVRKLDDLAHGRGGMTTRKALVGCKNMRIFETYVNNTGAGERILWTELGDNSICVWYVPRHKNVSRMMKMIDEADERSERRLTSAAVLLSGKTEMCVDAHTKTIGDDRVFLDPFSDTPLKVYDIPREEILKLVSPKWKPRLHLTRQEREIVQTEGTVLLLGRSGTGYVVVCRNER